MSNANATIAQKVAMIFGIGTQVVGTYGKNKVTYSDGKSKLEFDLTEENRKQVGVYTVTVTSDTELNEEFQKPPATASTGKTGSPSASQSPSNYLSGRNPR